jgi:hypothetical protein
MKQHHSLDPKVAAQVGVNAALIIWNLSYLQSQRELQGGDDFYHEGKWWVRHSYESLAEWHNYLSVDQIRRIMKKLEDDGHVSKASLGKNPWDRTTYWSVSPVFLHVADSPNACVGIAGSDVAKSPDVQQKNNSKQDDPRFEEFWFSYPKKKDKKVARRYWHNLTEQDREAALVRIALKPFKDTDPKFIPLPSSWINKARWEDELDLIRKPKIL